jgi:hypothetical protein
MTAAVLEQILSTTPAPRARSSIDVYVTGTQVLYTPPPSNNFGFGMHAPARFTDNTVTNNRFDRQTTLNDYGITPYEHKPLWQPPKVEPLPPAPEPFNFKPEPLIEIVPYKNGMELEGGFRLHGSHSTAVIHDPYANLNIHHHDKGVGAIKFNNTGITLCDGTVTLKKKYDDYL